MNPQRIIWLDTGLCLINEAKRKAPKHSRLYWYYPAVSTLFSYGKLIYLATEKQTFVATGLSSLKLLS
ncbi:hypothetical protein L873DRAFT_1810421 [Choiromyces venosus 120613-1]|uniref:Uncharacterized protein n=1 Tax=Choiromyces venosus 120613-1 TaxID=1336337 RepID=A0A3N4JF95_9PEZI|nr:hypothetical protein L873DRAFT_1810421 [Choiromyces venosus 120613-1]